ncbi:MAG TPA: glycosyltransferase family 39 protein [Candidatus Binatia bacterium]|nr:glycosyltransferase family 39 protein [Candidatus Binatia bacterium]
METVATNSSAPGRKLHTAGETTGTWLERNRARLAFLVILPAFAARLWAARGTFLNPDEALHFRLANQPSLGLAYQASLTNSHPPLLFFLLYFWRALGHSEIILRLPSVLAGTVFCWIFCQWMRKVAGELSAFIALLFVAFLPTVVQLGAEVRQYALLMAFLAAGLYLLDDAFASNSPARMLLSALFLCLAGLSQYSGFLFIIALGIYALYRIAVQRPPHTLVAAWAAAQAAIFALAVFLYKTHLSRLGGTAESHPGMRVWLNSYLPRGYFDRAHDHAISFLVGHSFGIFQYFFGQLAVGDVMGLLFVVGLALLFRGSKDVPSAQRLGVLFLCLFAVAAAAGFLRLYPYSSTRHAAFLAIPAMAAVSIAIAQICSNRWTPAVLATAIILAICILFSQPRRPWIPRADQSIAHMSAAMNFIHHNAGPADVIFTDYESDLILGHYLCEQQPIALQSEPSGYEQFQCTGRHVVSLDFRGWSLTAQNFPEEWRRFEQTFPLQPGQNVWIFQAGWDTGLPENLRGRYTEFRDLKFESFGNNIKLFKLAAVQSAVSAPAN